MFRTQLFTANISGANTIQWFALVRCFGAILLLIVFLSQTNAQYYGGGKNDRGRAFCEHGNRYTLIAETRSFGRGSEDVWLVSTDQDLEEVSHRDWGTPKYDIPTDIIATSNGDLVITGYAYDAPNGRTGIFLSRFNAAGDELWTSWFGGDHNDYGFSVTSTADGGFLLTGINREEGALGAIFLIKTDQDGQVEWEQFYDSPGKDIGRDVIEREDGTILVLATSNSFVGPVANSSEYLSEYSQVMVLGVASDGTELWRNSYGGPNHDFATRMAVGPGNDFYFIGSSMDQSAGSFDMTLHRLDEVGQTIWIRNFGGIGYEYGNDLDVNEAGDLLLTGTSSSFSDTEAPDVYVVKVDADGNELWSQTLGGMSSEYGNGGRFLNNGQIGIIGTAQDEAGDQDVLFVTLSSVGVPVDTLSRKSFSHPIVSEVLLYPMPAQDRLHICVNEEIAEQEITFSLYDLSGRPVLQKHLSGPFSTINLNRRFATGVYLYSFESDGFSQSGKILINR